ncbi:MAG: hypothetical protein LBK06_10010 [Planctomycetaceae bacterium]|jgi:hypothetical protein|nr:hypothetical protein [Planctomycetaceae bacterium]
MSENIDYPKGITFEMVWATMQENQKRFQERLDKLSDKYDAIFEREAKERKEQQKAFEEQQKEWQKEAELRRKEAEERQKEAEERRRKEAEERRKEADERRKEAEERRKEAEERRKEAEKRQKEADERQKEADERRRKELEQIVSEANHTLNETSRNLNTQMGELSNRFGELAEHLVAPGIEVRLNELGYHFEGVTTNFKVKKDGRVVTEVDLLLENAETIAIVEVKSKPTRLDIDRHIDRMKIVRHFFDNHRYDKKYLIGAVAGAIFLDHVKQYTILKGFYAITQSGDTLKIDVPEGFTPTTF